MNFIADLVYYLLILSLVILLAGVLIMWFIRRPATKSDDWEDDEDYEDDEDDEEATSDDSVDYSEAVLKDWEEYEVPMSDDWKDHVEAVVDDRVDHVETTLNVSVDPEPKPRRQPKPTPERTPKSRQRGVWPLFLKLMTGLGYIIAKVFNLRGSPQESSLGGVPRAVIYSGGQVGRPSNIAPAGRAAGRLYLVTLLVESVASVVRSAIFFVLSLILLSPLYALIFFVLKEEYFGPLTNAFGQQTNQWGYDYAAWIMDSMLIFLSISLVVGFLIGFGPVLRSLFHRLFPFTRSGGSEADALGARAPTRSEHDKIVATLSDILETARERNLSVAGPSGWLVVDEPTQDAFTIGSTVFLTRGAVEGDFLHGIIAHELGHIAHKDGDLILGLRRFMIPLVYYLGIDRSPLPAGSVVSTGADLRQSIVRGEDEKLFFRFSALRIRFWMAFWFGGMGLLLMGWQWSRFWRRRDYWADDYAAGIGQEDSLIGVLNMYRHVDVAQPYLLTNRPYTAERIDRLEG